MTLLLLLLIPLVGACGLQLLPKESPWVRRTALAVPVAVLAIVLVIVLLTKFTKGAWIVCIAMPIIYAIMSGIKRHYDNVAEELRAEADETVPLPSRIHAIILESRSNRSAAESPA